VHVELGVDVLEVAADGGRRDPQLVRDLGVGLPVRDEREYLVLAGGQQLGGRGGERLFGEEQRVIAVQAGDDQPLPIALDLQRPGGGRQRGAVEAAAIVPHPVLDLFR
jgi:hypothetical protein